MHARFSLSLGAWYPHPASTWLGTMLKTVAPRAVLLIKDLLDLSRIQTGKFIYRDERFLLNDMITEVIDATTQSEDRKATKVILEEDIMMKGDRSRMSQVLINLLSNAYKYSPKNTRVAVKTQKKKNTVIISVQDFGIGIAKAHQRKIFEPEHEINWNLNFF